VLSKRFCHLVFTGNLETLVQVLFLEGWSSCLSTTKRFFLDEKLVAGQVVSKKICSPKLTVRGSLRNLLFLGSVVSITVGKFIDLSLLGNQRRENFLMTSLKVLLGRRFVILEVRSSKIFIVLVNSSTWSPINLLRRDIRKSWS